MKSMLRKAKIKSDFFFLPLERSILEEITIFQKKALETEF